MLDGLTDAVDDDDDNDGIPDNREYILLPEEIQVDIWQLTVT